MAAAAVATGLVTGAGPVGAATSYVQASGALRDLAPMTANATDGASAQLYAVASGSSTSFRVFFTGLKASSVGARYGVHIHVGPCVAGDPGAAGPHYNAGGPPTAQTEVWLDFTVRAGGFGYAVTTVPFRIASGAARSMVVHALPTAPGGAAGPRQACLPVSF